jgi:hypothetical protein
MSDQRPRPQYGEYASTEERLAAGGAPLEDAPPRPETRIEPTAVKAPPRDPAISGPLVFPWDRALTSGLLAFGGISIITSAPNLLDFASTMREVYTTAGTYGEYTSDTLANGIGVAVLAAQAVVFAITLMLSIRRLRTGRRAFFVPLIGAVAAGIITFVLVVAAMVGDPALATYINSQT